MRKPDDLNDRGNQLLSVLSGTPAASCIYAAAQLFPAVMDQREADVLFVLVGRLVLDATLLKPGERR